MILQPLLPESTIQPGDIPTPPLMPEEVKILAMIKANVAIAEGRLRERNIPTKWQEADQLYNFYVPQQSWDGTRVARSSLGRPIVLEHTNAILAQIQDILFEEDMPFYPVPRSNGTRMGECRAHAGVLDWELEKADFEEEAEAGNHSALLLGNGIWKAYWHKKDGYMCPKFEFIEPEHILVDPSLRRPDIRKAKWVAHVTYMTPQQIDKMRDREGAVDNFPSLDELKRLGEPPRETGTELQSEANSQFQLPEFNTPQRSRPASVNPLHAPLKVIEYMDRNFVYTVLSDKRLLIKVDNSKRDKLIYLSSYFIRVKGQFYGMGVARLIGDEQRFQQGVLNAFIDNLALTIHPIFKKVRGGTLFPQQIRVQPGLVVDVDKADDFDVVDMPGAKNDIFQALTDSDQRSQRLTGANEVTVQGSFPDSSGGIGRTAAGMNALAQAAGVRMRQYCKTFEKQVLIPFLEFLQRTNPTYLSNAFIEKLLGDELYNYYYYTDPNTQETYQIDPKLVTEAKLKFKLLTPTKMKRRSAMLAAVPQLISFFQQDSTQQALKDQFKKLDFNELIWMLFDSVNWPDKSSLVVDMTQEEQMKLATENDLLKQLLIQKVQTQIQSQAKIQQIDAENAGRAVRDILKARLDNEAVGQEQKFQAAQLAGGLMAHQEINNALPPELTNPQPMPQTPVAPVGENYLGSH